MRRLLGALVVVMTMTAACNDDSGSADVDDIPTTLEATTSSSTSTTAPGNEQTTPPSIPGPVEDRGVGEATDGSVDIELENFAFDPTYIRAAAGARVTVSLRNESSAPHTFTIAGQGVDEEVSPGADAEVTVALPREGPVVFVCRFHESQGMKGAFYFQ